MEAKEKKRTPNKKAKSRKVWGIIFLVLAAIAVLDWIILTVSTHEADSAILKGGLVFLVAGIVLILLSGRAADETAEPEKESKPAAAAETKEEAVFRVREIFDEETRKEIYSNLDTLSRIYKNFFGDSNDVTVKLVKYADLFKNSENSLNKSRWMETANFLKNTAKMEYAANYKDAFVQKGEKAIRDFLNDK